MITARDLDPPVKVGRNANKLHKNWSARWTLALIGKTHSVWFSQDEIKNNELHCDCDEATQEDWAKRCLKCFEADDFDSLGTEVLVIENGLTPETDRSLSWTRHMQASEAIDKDAQRKRVGMF